jgi:multicomponent K+:H+ antiporter subunit A
VYSLAVWHGFTLPLLMSLIAVSGGTLGYVWLRERQKAGRFQNPPLVERLNGRRLFDRVMAGLTRLSRSALPFVGTRHLQTQLFVVVAVAVLLPLLAAWGFDVTWGDRPRLPASYPFVVLWTIGMICAVGAAAMAKFHRLVAITLMGGAGLVTSLTFVWFSAPDLALTQLVVEVVTTILFLLGLRWLPIRHRDVAGRLTPRDWAMGEDPTSSTSCSSTFARSTHSARSPSSESSRSRSTRSSVAFGPPRRASSSRISRGRCHPTWPPIS